MRRGAAQRRSMKSKNSDGDDAPLDALLQEWKPKPALPTRFQEQVWRRIERAETAPVPTVSLATVFGNVPLREFENIDASGSPRS